MERSLIICLFWTLIYLHTINACFIRNCPPGGKRSMDLVSIATHECARCGPQLTGQCVGPNICCGVFGCLMGTLETEVCSLENENTEPCEIQSKPCGDFGKQNCVARGLCCDSDSCSFDRKCRGETNSRQLMSFLQTLLQNDDYK